MNPAQIATEDRHRRGARAIQALAGILITAAGVAAFDWRAGLTAFGLLTLATSAPWRSAK